MQERPPMFSKSRLSSVGRQQARTQKTNAVHDGHHKTTFAIDDNANQLRKGTAGA